MKHLLLLCLFLIPAFTCSATEAYGGSYTYRLKLYKGKSTLLINTAVTLTIQGESQTVETDAEGFITITVERYGACPSSKGYFERLFLRDSWTPEVIELSFEGSSARIHRNWKRVFRKVDKCNECFDFKRGKIVNDRRI